MEGAAVRARRAPWGSSQTAKQRAAGAGAARPRRLCWDLFGSTAAAARTPERIPGMRVFFLLALAGRCPCRGWAWPSTSSERSGSDLSKDAGPCPARHMNTRRPAPEKSRSRGLRGSSGVPGGAAQAQKVPAEAGRPLSTRIRLDTYREERLRTRPGRARSRFSQGGGALRGQAHDAERVQARVRPAAAQAQGEAKTDADRTLAGRGPRDRIRRSGRGPGAGVAVSSQGGAVKVFFLWINGFVGVGVFQRGNQCMSTVQINGHRDGLMCNGQRPNLQRNTIEQSNNKHQKDGQCDGLMCNGQRPNVNVGSRFYSTSQGAAGPAHGQLRARRPGPARAPGPVRPVISGPLEGVPGLTAGRPRVDALSGPPQNSASGISGRGRGRGEERRRRRCGHKVAAQLTSRIRSSLPIIPEVLDHAQAKEGAGPRPGQRRCWTTPRPKKVLDHAPAKE
eukprot:gene25784-biopygen1487